MRILILNHISGESIMSEDEEKVERKKVTRRELDEKYSFLKKFVIEYMGLTEKEADIYITLIFQGPLTAGELELHTGFDYSEVESILKELVGKNAVKEIKGVVSRYRASPPFLGITKVLISHGEELSSLSESLSKEIKEKTDELKDFAKKSEDDFIKTLHEIRDSYNAKIEDNLKEIDGKCQEILTKMENSIDELTKRLNDALDTLKRDMDRKIDENKSTIDKMTENEKEAALRGKEVSVQEITKAKEENQNRVRELIDRFSSQFETEVDNVANLLKGESSKFKSETERIVADHVSELNSIKEQIISHVDNTVADTKDKLFSNFDDAGKKLIEAVASSKEKQKVVFSSLFNTMSLNYEQMIKSNQDELQKLSAKISEILDTGLSDIGSTISQFDDQVLSTIVSHKQDAIKKVDAIKKEIERSKASQQKKIRESYQMARGTFEKAITRVEQQLVGLLQSQNQGLVNTINSTAEQNKMYIDKVQSAIDNAFNEALESIKRIFDATKETLLRETQNMNQNMISLSTTLSQKVNESSNEAINLFKNAITQFSNEFSKALESSQSMSINMLETTSDKIATTADAVYNETIQSILKVGNDTKNKLVSLKDKISASQNKMEGILF